jgi:hypothetical protein
MRKLQPWATTTLDELSWNIPPRTAGTLTRRGMTYVGCRSVVPRPLRALWTTATCGLASGRSRPWRTIARRMGAVAEMVLAAAHDREEIAPASLLCGIVRTCEAVTSQTSSFTAPSGLGRCLP